MMQLHLLLPTKTDSKLYAIRILGSRIPAKKSI